MNVYRQLASVLVSACCVAGCAANTCGPDGGCDAGVNYPDAANKQYVPITYEVMGLQNGQSVTLRNADIDLAITSNGLFVAQEFVTGDQSYAISIGRQPERQTCEVRGTLTGVADGSGINVAVGCGARMSGVVKGLIRGATVDVSNGLETLHITQPGPFSFARMLPTGTELAQSVTDITGGQSCKVTPEFGVASGNIDDVVVICDDLWTLSWYLGGDAGHVDGDNPKFDNPWAMVRARSGDIYVSELSHDIRKISNGVARTIAGSENGTPGYRDGPGQEALFYYPTGLAYDDDSGVLYVADTFNNRVRKVAPLPDGGYQVSTFAGDGLSGYGIGSVRNVQLSGPGGLLLDVNGNLWVSSGGGQNGVVSRISTGGWVTLEGNCGGYVSGRECGMVFDPTNTDLLLTDPNVSVIRVNANANKYYNRPWSVLAGQTTSWGDKDGKGTEAMFRSPMGIVLNPDGYYYIAERKGNRIRRLSRDGTVVTISGDGGYGFAPGDGVRASIPSPTSIVVESEDTMLVTSLEFNSIYRLSRKR